VPPNTPAAQGEGPKLSMNAPLAITAEEEAAPKTGVEKALSDLVNFDDITEPAEKQLKLTMMAQETEKKQDPNKSVPIPPVGKNMVGSGATLQQIQEIKPEAAQKDPNDIMKPPPQLFDPNAVHAGALVVHGQGPPPIQQGFGVGYGPPPQTQQYTGFRY